jgi:hypothetical protein
MFDLRAQRHWSKKRNTAAIRPSRAMMAKGILLASPDPFAGDHRGIRADRQRCRKANGKLQLGADLAARPSRATTPTSRENSDGANKTGGQ